MEPAIQFKHNNIAHKMKPIIMLRKLYEKIIPYEKRLRFHKWRNQEEYKTLRKKVYPSEKGDFSLKPFDENKCIFIHVTKTAGTSVALSLFGYLPYHYTGIEYRVIYGKNNFNDYYKFAFVRNPWDRLYSAYRYLKAGGWNEKDQTWADNNISDYDDFNQFVLNWVNKSNIEKHIHFKPQYEFLYDTNNNLLVNHLAYFETINDDFTFITNKLKLNASLGKHNANPGDSYRDIYTEESIAIVKDIYAKDINLFGYEFGGIKKRVIL